MGVATVIASFVLCLFSNVFLRVSQLKHENRLKNSMFRCGDSFEILDKLNELERSESCFEEKFRVYLNKKLYLER